MSWENMLSFMEKIESDPELAMRVRNLDDDIDGFIRLSDAQGCPINFKDLEQLAFICNADAGQVSWEKPADNSA